MAGVQPAQPRREGQYTYVILLTARGRKEDVVFGMEAGADDYITKPFDADELKVRLRAATRILDLQSELIAAQETLRHQATHDSLTGLWNRMAIMDRLQQELARACRENGSVGAIMVDVDHFKRINDTFGHKSGDAALCEVARRLKQAVRLYDAIGRYGGEEFLIVLPGCDVTATAHQAERMRTSILAEGVNLGPRTLGLTISLGVASSGPGQEIDGESLVHAADTALYRAKHAGRNRVEVAQSLAAVGAGRDDLADASWCGPRGPRCGQVRG